MPESNSNIDPLLLLYMINGLNRVSNRLYYLYYRFLQSMSGQQESISTFTFGVLVVAVSTVVGLINLTLLFRGVSAEVQYLAFAVSVLVGAVMVWALYDRLIPRATPWDTRQEVVSLGIQLSEIRSWEQELKILDANV